MKKLQFLSVVMFTIVFCYACQKNGSNENTLLLNNAASLAPDDSIWALDSSMSDYFNGATLDTTKWSADPLWYWDGKSGDIPGQQLAYKKANVIFYDSAVHLVARHETTVSSLGNTYYFTAGCLKSKFEIGGDSYVRVRAKMVPRLANVCAAIWLGDEPVAAKMPNIEIDMQETKDADNGAYILETSLLNWNVPYGGVDMNGDTIRMNKVWFGQQYPQTFGLDWGFHTYGLERRDGKLRFYLDDVLYKEWDASAMPEFVTQLRPLILSLEAHAGMPNTTYLPDDFAVDWVEVYHVR